MASKKKAAKKALKRPRKGDKDSSTRALYSVPSFEYSVSSRVPTPGSGGKKK